MSESMQGEHCVLCSADAAVRVSGTSFCASCGLAHYAAGMPKVTATGRKRAAIFGLLSSGLVVKMLLGAVAVAAMGGVAASAVHTEPTVPVVDTTVAEVSTTVAAMPGETAIPAAASSSTTPTTTEPVSVTEPVTVDRSSQVAAQEYAAAIEAWADCVSTEASAHSGGPFDPHAACPNKPTLGEYGLDGPDDTVPPGHDPDGPGNSENAPGHDDGAPGNSENAPGHDDGAPGNSENAPGKKDRD